MNVLIIDDNANDRRLLRCIFEHHNCTVIEAQDGEEGLELAARHSPDIIVSDALMPRMDGFQLLRALKTNQKLKTIPFLFYSATYTGEQEAEFALSVGAEAFIIKPTEPDELWRKTCSIMKEWETRQGAPSCHVVEESDTEFFRDYSQIVATKLESKVLELEEALKQRKLAEDEVRTMNAELERRVNERTAELAQRSKELEESRLALVNLVEELQNTNTTLSAEILRREQAQTEITWLNEDLQNQKLNLEAANKELESFSYSVSHDLRTPLRHIDTFSKMLQEECSDRLDDAGQDYLQRIRKSCSHMNRLIDELLTLSKLSRTPLRSEKVNLSAMTQEIADQLFMSDPTRKVDITVTKDLWVTGDPTLLRAVLENLLGNAWKYSHKKAQTLIEFGVIQDSGKPVYFVKDNGAGFDMEYTDKLFGVFQRLHKQEEFEGTGVGLATVKRIIHRHGGKVWAEGKVDAGATFFFTLE